MATKTKQWSSGIGSATIQYGGHGDGEIIITTDPNNLYEARSMQITVETTNGSPKQTKTITINQAAKQRIDISAAVVTASNQTYNGSAKTPTPTVTLNGTTIPSTGYDVAYSDNTNAGTATITITGKGDYTGVAYGTFTINKATPSYTAPATRSLTYNGSSQYLTTSGSTSHGTIYYSTDGSNWYTSRRTGTNAGTYYCYWKLVGDSNHTDISSTYLGTTTIAKASRSMSWSTYPSSLYVGRSSTLSATPSAGSSDGTISYSSSNSSKASVSGNTVTAVASGTCTIYASISEGTNYLSASISYTLTVKAVPSNCVDMGNNVFWAVGNITKNTSGNYSIASPTTYGAYFSWADIDGHNVQGQGEQYGFYSSDYSNGSSGSGHNIYTSYTSGDSTYDAARAKLGGTWRVPTKAEFEWLMNTSNCSSEFVTNYKGSGINGMLFTSKINGNTLFLPAAGRYNNGNYLNSTTHGFYWSNEYAYSTNAYYLNISNSGASMNNVYRYNGFSIRPVMSA